MKSVSLKQTLLKMVIYMKNGNKKKASFVSVGLKWDPRTIFKKKSHLNLSNLEKRYQITIFAFVEHFSKLGPEKKLDQDTRQPI